ncbi:CubicO group peptidase, beta-lactamase class C family [Draconibacterium orientale]|uniref:CubicO group peptidase, beta-lactamase class C family n=1 Tax=Draconibacterium orientale TaxID=1168034 RepID=A0A1I0DIR4_9BACT|nr:serine hydrolase domain-containing protein [Draconibacterium orientale]SET32006.1 CubicO group peptidase, beta-lactamase class C family [Draconibacterium orientale]
MKKFTLLFVLSLFLFSLSDAQTRSILKSSKLVEAAPESAGISAERLARIDKMCEEEVAKGNLPGIVSLVARNGKIVHWKAYGVANENGDEMKRDAIFRIASQTKAITSTAVMMLWEEGKFQLDDPISKYIPEFKNQQVLTNFRYSDTTWTGVPVKNEITVRHLLTHTSGIGYGIIDSDERFKMLYQKAGVTDLFTTKNITIKESVKNLAKMPLHCEPGTQYRYCEGLDVLGYFIEVVSGMPFDQYLKIHIFDPLGMEDTWFYQPEKNIDRVVDVLQVVNGEWQKYPVTFYDADYPVKGAKTFFSGGAGLSSTAKDYAIFLQMYLNGGEYNGIRLLSRTTVDVILSNQIGDLWVDSDSKYGLAFGLLTAKGESKGGMGSEGTFSWGGYFNTQYFADPGENVIGIILKQTQGPVNDVTGWKFGQLVFQAIDD